MYCILVTGMPAAGKSTMARQLSERLALPVASKDTIKELLFDTLGFRSREEKVSLGVAGMHILYYFAEQLMKRDMPFILENNFENISKPGIDTLLRRYGYTAITVLLTGDYPALYTRFLERNGSPERHRGHVVNRRYPEDPNDPEPGASVTLEQFVAGITQRGMDSFTANGPRLVIDTTDFSRVRMDEIVRQIDCLRDETLENEKRKCNCNGQKEMEL